MKNKYIFLVLAIMFLPLAGLAAQDKGGGESNSYSIFSFDIGYGVYFPFESTTYGDWGTVSYFGLNIRIADPLTIGVGTYGLGSPSNNISLLKVKYDIIPLARAVIGLGVYNSSPTPNLQTMLGFEILPFARKISGLASEFKLDVNYSFPDADIGKGVLCMGLVVGLGL